MNIKEIHAQVDKNFGNIISGKIEASADIGVDLLLSLVDATDDVKHKQKERLVKYSSKDEK